MRNADVDACVFSVFQVCYIQMSLKFCTRNNERETRKKIKDCALFKVVLSNCSHILLRTGNHVLHALLVQSGIRVQQIL